jgi:hypothetical protein
MRKVAKPMRHCVGAAQLPTADAVAESAECRMEKPITGQAGRLRQCRQSIAEGSVASRYATCFPGPGHW